MQDAGSPSSRTLRASLLALAALGTLGTGLAGMLAGWQAGVACYALVITACLAAMLHAVDAGERHDVPVLVPVRPGR